MEGIKMNSEQMKLKIAEMNALLAKTEEEERQLSRDEECEKWITETDQEIRDNPGDILPDLLRELWELKNPLVKINNPPKAKKCRKKAVAKITFGRCPCRCWGNGFGAECNKQRIGEGKLCALREKELSEKGSNPLGMWDEPRPTKWVGHAPSGKKIGNAIPWKNPEPEKVGETSDESSEEEEIVQDTGAETETEDLEGESD